MRPGRLLALATVVLALGAYIYFVERHRPTTDEITQRRDKLFPDLDPAKTQRIVVANAKGRFELEKRDGSWVLVSPLADDANEGAVSALFSALMGLKAARTLEAKDVKLADMGLEPTALSVALTDDKGTERALSVGAEMPLGGNRAARTDGELIYVVPSTIATELDKDLAAWRSTNLARLFATDVASLVIRGATGELTLVHSGDVWTITKPIADLAERRRADALVADISAAQIQEFVDAPGELRSLGLDPPQLAMTFERKDGKPKVELAFGVEREKDGAAQRICRRGERVVWVNTSATAKATASALEWRSLKLAGLDSWNAIKLEIAKGQDSVKLERKDGIWQANGSEVDGDAVSRRLTMLADLEVAAFDRPKPAGAATGSVAVTVGDGSVVEASIYPGANPSESVAVVAGRSGALAIDAGKAGELLSDPSSLAKPKPALPAAPAATPGESGTSTPSDGAPKAD